MGKLLRINGADFSVNSILKNNSLYDEGYKYGSISSSGELVRGSGVEAISTKFRLVNSRTIKIIVPNPSNIRLLAKISQYDENKTFIKRVYDPTFDDVKDQKIFSTDLEGNTKYIRFGVETVSLDVGKYLDKFWNYIKIEGVEDAFIDYNFYKPSV